MRSVKTLGFPAFMMEQDSKLAAMPVAAPVAAPVAVALGWKRPLLVVLVLAAASVGGGYWWLHRPPGLPLGIAFGNGRLEADEIDIDTKFAGRVARLDVDEGDVVVAGQVVGLMDSQDLEASLGQARALVLPEKVEEGEPEEEPLTLGVGEAVPSGPEAVGVRV
jgi:multidrug efflux pump subunit AcrA (membrane-fusion protein)